MDLKIMTIAHDNIDATHDDLIKLCIEYHHFDGEFTFNNFTTKNEKLYIFNDYSCIIRNDAGENCLVEFIDDLLDGYLDIMGYSKEI